MYAADLPADIALESDHQHAILPPPRFDGAGVKTEQVRNRVQ